MAMRKKHGRKVMGTKGTMRVIEKGIVAAQIFNHGMSAQTTTEHDTGREALPQDWNDRM
jgi:hypothetical protein